MRFNPDSTLERSGRRNQGSGRRSWAECAGLYLAGLCRKNDPRRIHPGGIRGRRGIIGGYWGGYNSLSSSPTPKALPGKVENLTPPANGKNAPDGAQPAQTEGQSSSAPRAAALAFFFCPSPRLPPARPAGSAARHALGAAAAVSMTTPAHRSRSRSRRPPPAPGRISTASAAPDDHASSRPPPRGQGDR